MKTSRNLSIAFVLALVPIAGGRQERAGRGATIRVENTVMVIEANPTTGNYVIRTKGEHADSLAARVAAKVTGAWLRSSDYPEQKITEGRFRDDFGEGPQLTILSTGLAGAPDLVAKLRLHSIPAFAEIEVEVRNSTDKALTVQAIRVLEGEGNAVVNLNGQTAADRVLSDSFSEDRPTMAVRDLPDSKNGLHRAVGSQLIYNRESGQSLFLGALTSERWLTVLRLHLDTAKTKISGYEVDSTGTTELTKDNSLRRSPPEDQIELSLPVAPGESLRSERLMVSLGFDYHAQLEAYGDVIRRLHHARVSAPTPLGWWSWTAYFFGLNQGTAMTNAQWVSENLKSAGYSFFHIDEGYQYARGEYTTPDAALFPSGMKLLESKVRSLGLTPGIWTAPFEVSDRSSVYENHKDWLVHNATGQPIHSAFVQGGSKERLYALDTTNPSAQNYLRKTYGTLVKDWGIRYIKLDFMEDSAVEGYHYRPNTTALEAQRIGLQVIRDTVGDDVLLDKDGSPMLNPVGIVDTGRISADTSHDFGDIRAAASGIAARYYMNRNFFINDPDAFCVSKQTDSDQDQPLSLDEATVSIALASVAGGMFEIGDDLPTLSRDADRLALVRNPELIRIARWGHASTPVDLMTFPPEQAIPSAFVLHEGPQRAVVTLFNWSDKPYTRSYDLSARDKSNFWNAFGLPSGNYTVRDALDGLKQVEVAGGHFTLIQPPHSVRMLIFEKTGRGPQEIKSEVVGPAATQAGQTVTLSARATDGGFPVVGVRWNFGDGTTAEGNAVDHSYTLSGKYNIMLKTEGVDGRIAETIYPIDVTGSIDKNFKPSHKRRPGEQPQTSSPNDPGVGTKVPDFDLAGIGGQKISSKNVKGKIAVIAFWAAWCGPCREEMPGLEKLYQKYLNDPDVKVLTIVDARDLDEVKKFIAAQHLTLPVLISNGYMSKVNIDSFPRTWFVDRQGSIRYVETEEKDHLFDEFSERIERMRKSEPASPPSPVAFVVHGGVDNAKSGELSASDEEAIRAGITRALKAGYAVLQRGDSSIDAVEAALRTFEDDTTFDAGRGSVVNTEGVAELDAAIMDGNTLKAGSVAALQHIPHPISLARLVMDRSPHVMLVGQGAEKFATSQGLETVPNSFFITPSRKEKYQQWLRSHGAAGADIEKHHGTTGAVALDRNGNLAAGTTTGGTSWKLPGRVGDSPLIGAGTYANNELGCAVSSSGTGEYFIRNTVATDICRRVSYLHQSIDQAANYVINTELKEQKGDGGVIVLDRSGHFARVFNTNAFWVGYIDADGSPVVQIFK